MTERRTATGPVVVGINRTQDGSVCVASPDSLTSLQKERITRRKHHWGRLGDLPDRYRDRLPELHQRVDLVVECWSSDDEARRMGQYHDELRSTLRFNPGARVVPVSHHLAHAYSAFLPSPFDAAAIMVIDAQGSRAADFTETVPGAAPTGAGHDPRWAEQLEISSFYRWERSGAIECLGKQLWDGDWADPAGLGCFYALLTRAVFPVGDGNEGKVMGLAAFGRPDALDLPPLEVEGFEVSIPAPWLDIFDQGDLFHLERPGADFKACADLAAAGQRAFEEAILRVAGQLRRTAGLDDLCFAGGTALNCSANGRLLRETGFGSLFIPPSPHDGGTAVGCALYGLREILGRESSFRWTNDFLGPQPDQRRADDIAQAIELSVDPALTVERPDDLPARMAELLAEGRVVAVCEGRSESGPRALGHRSILADARHPGMQDHINFRVKGREWFRPLAPLVLAEHAAEIFDIDRPAPFMQLATDVRPEHRAALPAITHVDGTARLQTVEPVETPFLHAVLAAFEARTGCPVLLNTSLNAKGDPLVETPEEALACLRTTAMHALALPPWLILKPAEPPVPTPEP